MMSSSGHTKRKDAETLIRTLGEDLPRHVKSMVKDGPMFYLEELLVALSAPQHAEFCRGKKMRHQLPLALQAWSDGVGSVRIFYDKWNKAFPGSPAIAYEKLVTLTRDKKSNLTLAGAKRLVALALQDGEDVREILSPVVSNLTQWSAFGNTENYDAALKLFEHLVRLDAKAHPGEMLRLSWWKHYHPFDSESGSFSRTTAYPDADDGPASTRHSSSLLLATLLLKIPGSEKTPWLDVLTRVYGANSKTFKRGALDCMNELLDRNRSVRSTTWLVRVSAEALERGWVDKQMADTLLTTVSCFDKFQFDSSDHGNASFGAALAYLSATDADGLSKALAMVKTLHAVGGDLDAVVTVENAVPSMRKWSMDDKNSGITWTGTLLHKAVEEGSPSLVALLLQLGCDPDRKAIFKRVRSGKERERNCIEILDALDMQKANPAMLERREAVELVLRAWKAQVHAKEAMGLLLRASP